MAVLHDLGREPHPVAGNVDTGETLDGDIAEQLVEEVSELVEDGFHLTMGKEGGLVPDWFGEVPCDQAEMRLAGCSVLSGKAGLQIIHPGAAALGFPWMPVGVERAEVLA